MRELNANELKLYRDVKEKVISKFDQISALQSANISYRYDENKYIYHYTNANALKNILEKESLWVSNARYLNDSSEIKYSLDLISSVAEEIEKLSFADNSRTHTERIKISNLFEEMMNVLNERILEILEEVYVLSTSTNKDSLTLWNNYSNFEGYNIGFEKERLDRVLRQCNLKEDNDGNIITVADFRIIGKDSNKHINIDSFNIIGTNVVYNIQKQKEMINDYLSILFNDICGELYHISELIVNKKLEKTFECPYTIKESIKRFYIQIMASKLALISVFLKSPQFYQEEEIRYVFVKRNNEDNKNERSNILKYRINNGVYIPYIEVSFKNEKQSNEHKIPINSICIGPKNNLDIAELGIKSILNDLGYDLGKIKVKKSEIPLRY